LIGKEHPHISYVKDEKITSVLTKALAETFRVRPNNPKEFFGRYLLNYSA